MNETSNIEIVRILGVGGMATVYLAHLDEGGTRRDVAVKKLHPFLADDSASVEMIEDEAELGARIRHPNVVNVIGVMPATSPGDAPALVMEWIDGVDLGKLVRATTTSGRKLPLDVVAAIGRDVLAGLHAAHESRHADGASIGVVHRDVSPANVLVGFDGVTRVTDFGVAKASRRHQHTELGTVKGKLAYVAPEQLDGSCDRRSDLYSAGVVLWELLTGARMRTGDGVEMLVEILCGHVTAPSTVAPEAACLDALVTRALSRFPEDRFATAHEMLHALESRIAPASPARVAAVVREVLGVTEPVAKPVDDAAITERFVPLTPRVRITTVAVATVVASPSRGRRSSVARIAVTARPPPEPRVPLSIDPLHTS